MSLQPYATLEEDSDKNHEEQSTGASGESQPSLPSPPQAPQGMENMPQPAQTQQNGMRGDDQQGTASNVPQPVIMMKVPSPSALNVSSRALLSLSITQIVIAFLGFSFNIASMCLTESPDNVAYFIWGGILFMVTGSIGIVTGKVKTKCWVISSMVLNIISSVISLAVIGLSALCIALNTDAYHFYYFTEEKATLAMDILMSICGLTILVISITNSCILGKALCSASEQFFGNGQQVMASNVQPTILMNTPNPNQLNISSRALLSLSITQIVVAFLGFTFNIAGVCLEESTNVVGHFIWGGILFMVTGSIGIVTGKVRSKCLVLSSMVLNILSSVTSFVVIGLSAGGIVLNLDGYHYYYDAEVRASLAMDILMSICGLTIAVVSIVNSCILGRVVCCGPQQFDQGNVRYQPINGAMMMPTYAVQQSAPQQVMSGQQMAPQQIVYGQQMAPQQIVYGQQMAPQQMGYGQPMIVIPQQGITPVNNTQPLMMHNPQFVQEHPPSYATTGVTQ